MLETKNHHMVKINDDSSVTTIEGTRNKVFSLLFGLPQNQYEIIGLLEGMHINNIYINRVDVNDNRGKIKINNVWLDMKSNSETNTINIINHGDFFYGNNIGGYLESLIDRNDSNLLKYELGKFIKVCTHALCNGKIYEIVGSQEGMNVSAINTYNSTLTINNEILLSFTINEERQNIELIHSDNYYFLSMYGSMYPYDDSFLQSCSERTFLYKYVNGELELVQSSSGVSICGRPATLVNNFQELLEKEGKVNSK